MIGKDAAAAPSWYKYYVLCVLLVVYVMHSIDRQILSILLPGVKQELQLTDSQLGLLGGIAFAIFYAGLGLPLAWLSDRASRRTLTAVCLGAWSLMTAVCAAVVSFPQLLAARVGVAVGEAGGIPASHSMISDYFPPRQRASAFAVHSLGIPIGTLIGLGLGGMLAQHYGWRAVFLFAAAPGLFVAAILMFTVREPRRGGFDAAKTAVQPVGLGAALRGLFALKSYRHIVMGATMQGFAAYGQALWLPSYLSRSFGMNLAEIGVALGLIAGIAGGAGTLFGGWLGDRLGGRDVRWYMWLCALALAAAAPLSVGMLLAPRPEIALTFLCGTAFLVGMFFGPGYAVIQFMAAPAVRAVAMAAMFFVVNLFGMGLGPQLVGLLSDALAKAQGAESLRYAMLLIAGAKLWAALHYWRAAGFLRADAPGHHAHSHASSSLNPISEPLHG